MNDETTVPETTKTNEEALPPAQAPAVVKKAPLTARGGRPLPIVVTDVDQAWRYAGVAVEAHWTKMNQHEACMAILHGAEIGLTPVMSLQSIAVIDQRPSIYGDAVPAIALSTGQLESWEERIEGEGDNMMAVCVVKRRGLALPIEERFSVADAKTAGLWGKHNWKHYPKAMLKARARVAFRRAFADAFAGLPLAEEVDIRPAWRTVDNPMSDTPQVVESDRRGGTADSEVNVHPRRDEPAEETIDQETGEVITVDEPDPTTSSAAGRAYQAEALTVIINALDLEVLTSWWGREMGARIASGMPTQESDQLVEAYVVKRAALGGQEPT